MTSLKVGDLVQSPPCETVSGRNDAHALTLHPVERRPLCCGGSSHYSRLCSL